MKTSTEIAICGAGIAGISAAYFLAVKYGVRDILIFDPRPPLSLTSDKSTECYRNWWPGPGSGMVSLMNHSIDLLEELAQESGDFFNLSRRGYLYLTASPARIPAMRSEAQAISSLGAGPLRVYEGNSVDPVYQPSSPGDYGGEPAGADLILDPDLIHQVYPYLTENAAAALHVRRAGWFSAQQLGTYLLDQARLHGVKLIPARIAGVDVSSNRVQAVRLEDGSRVPVGAFVNAAGPMFKEVGHMTSLDLPVFSELHLKVAFEDYQEIIPRDAPMLIWTDPQYLPWTPEEKELITSDDENQELLEVFPGGVHTRPEGGPEAATVLMLWEYRTHRIEPIFPIPLDPQYPEIVLRGLQTMLPGLENYIQRSRRPVMDGGYYSRTSENRPLIGPTPVEGLYLIGAMSGFGLMSACGAGDLLARHITRSNLPTYAPDFALSRYQNPEYVKQIESQQSTGQL